MNETRQDAWAKDEDIILAETVLRYIREGKTQLEAFKEVAAQLSRTPAACGFRWNATIRKQYQEAIEQAKEERKKGNRRDVLELMNSNHEQKDTIESAILLLEKMKANFQSKEHFTREEHEKIVLQLENENRQLRQMLTKYDRAWAKIEQILDEVEAIRNN